MNGPHDLGGLPGLGAIPIEVDEPLFHESWHARIFGTTFASAVARALRIDLQRCAVEGIPPALYMSTTYYEWWLYALEECLVDAGALSREAIDERVQRLATDPDAPLPERDDPEFRAIVQAFIHHGIPAPPDPVQRTARFAVADAVETTVVEHPAPGREHTRIPGYAQGKTGVVERVLAPQSLPDAVVAGRGELPEHVYAVRFRARDLCPDAGARDSVCVDLWESYLRPAGAGPAATGEAS
jgi:nitrile hydratase